MKLKNKGSEADEEYLSLTKASRFVTINMC